jgi:benzoyl-CoA reductase/2-hydroxyglutaryl-CoA dehydratase subunit BcrC/BadD/HgdB
MLENFVKKILRNQCYDFKNIIEEIGHRHLTQNIVLMTKMDHSNGFEEKRLKVVKIAENNDHNIEPMTSIVRSRNTLFFRPQTYVRIYDPRCSIQVHT